jgi:hypothetical protein
MGGYLILTFGGYSRKERGRSVYNTLCRWADILVDTENSYDYKQICIAKNILYNAAASVV